jgi:hypothetical protein
MSYIGIEAAIFVDDDHAGQFAAGVGRPRKIAAHVSRALRRGIGQIFGLDARVIFGDLLRKGIVGPQALQHRGGCEAAYREFCGAIQKITAADHAVNVTIKQLENFWREIAGLFPFHSSYSYGWETRPP